MQTANNIIGYLRVTLAALFASVITCSMANAAGIDEEMKLAAHAMDEQDLAEAVKHYTNAAEQNHIPAQIKIGELMRTFQESETAVGWFMMAAYQGSAEGAYDLGNMYLAGEGVEKNDKKALYWTKYSADKNFLPAVESMYTAYKQGGLGLEKDEEQANKWGAKLGPLRAAAQKEVEQTLKEVRENRIKYLEETRKKEAEAAASGDTQSPATK